MTKLYFLCLKIKSFQLEVTITEGSRGSALIIMELKYLMTFDTATDPQTHMRFAIIIITHLFAEDFEYSDNN